MIDAVEDASPGRPVAAGWVVWLAIVLATVLGVGATLNSWVDRQALDTDRWVAVTDDMLADDDIRDALSQYLVRELFGTVDVAGEIEALLPGPSARLAGPIAATLQSNAVGLVDQLLGTDRFASLWRSTNQTAHTALVRVVRGEDGALLATSGGAFVVDLRELLVLVGERLGLPGGVGERLPDDAGQLVVFESDQIDSIQQTVRVIDLLSLYLFIVIVVLYAAAVYVARDRRVALRNVGFALVVGSVLLLIAQRATINYSVEVLSTAQSGRDAVRSIASIATSLLNELAWASLAMGVVIVSFSLLIGPSRAAVGARRLLGPAMTHPGGAWALALGVLVLYLLFGPGFSIDRWIPALVFVALFVAAVELLRRQVVAEYLAARPEP